MAVTIYVGHVLDQLRRLPDQSVQTVVTSPPYYGLRDYGTDPVVWGGDTACPHEWQEHAPSAQRIRNGAAGGIHEGRATNKLAENITIKTSQGGTCALCGAWRGHLGMEPTLALFIEHLVLIFREVKRVLRDDGTLWLNLGDSYAGSWGNQGRKTERGTQRPINGEMLTPVHDGRYPAAERNTGVIRDPGLKPKDLMMVPARVALALQDDGWWLRSDIIWAKPNPMPGSQKDRPTSSHEHLFLLTKKARYYYDHVAVQQPAKESTAARMAQNVEDQAGSLRANGGDARPMRAGGRSDKQRGHGRRHAGFNERWDEAEANGAAPKMAELRDVWHLATVAFKEAHFATFPPEIPRRCIKAGSRPGDTVLDIFGGSGTVGLVGEELGRDTVLIELKGEYAQMAKRRIMAPSPLLTVVEVVQDDGSAVAGQDRAVGGRADDEPGELFHRGAGGQGAGGDAGTVAAVVVDAGEAG